MEGTTNLSREDKILLIPGPTPVPTPVLRAQSRPIINHRSPEFHALFEELIAGLQEVFRTQQEVLLFTSSGTGGLESAIVNTLSPGDRVLGVSIGTFGDRFADLAEAYGAQVERLNFPHGTAADPEVVRERLAQDRQGTVRAVLLTHNETSTGVINDLPALSQVVREHGALLLVDAISGLIAAPLEMDAWGLDVVVAGSQKAFMIPPGLAFVAASERAWQARESARMPRFYFDWEAARKYAARRETPFTPAVSLCFALQEALQLIRAEGLERIQARHRRLRDAVRAGVGAMGLELVAAEECASPSVTAVYMPEGVSSKELRQILSQRYQTVIAGGRGQFVREIFRLGHLGWVDGMTVLSGLLALEMALRDLGLAVPAGAGVAAAREVLAGGKEGG